MSPSVAHLQAKVLESARPDDQAKQWVFVFSGEIALRVTSPWRLVVDDNIVLGWQDDGQFFGLPSAIDAGERVQTLLTTLPVEDAEVSPQGDLTLAFSGRRQLQVFNDSAGFEGWELNGPGQRRVVAQGGGRIVESDE